MRKIIKLIIFLMLYCIVQFVGLIVTMDEIACGCNGSDELWLYLIPFLLMMILLKKSTDGSFALITTIAITSLISIYTLSILYNQRDVISFGISIGQFIRYIYMLNLICLPITTYVIYRLCGYKPNSSDGHNNTTNDKIS